MGKRIKNKVKKPKENGEFSKMYKQSMLVYPLTEGIVIDADNEDTKDRVAFIKEKFEYGTYAGKVLFGESRLDIGHAFFVIQQRKMYKDDPKETRVYMLKLRVEIDKLKMPLVFKDGIMPTAEFSLLEDFNVLAKFNKEDFITNK